MEESYKRAGLALPRRTLLKGAGAAGLSTALGAPFINRLYAMEAHPLAGKKIDMNILGIAGWLPSSLGVKMSPLFADYVKQRYGYDVTFGFAEAPFSDLFQKAATSLATKSQEYNIIISDSQWLGALAKPGWILKLNDIIAKNKGLQLDWYSQTVIDTYMAYPDGTKDVWGLPQEGDTKALYVRKDLVQDPKEQAAFMAKYNMKLPSTFEDYENLNADDYEKVMEFFTRPEKGLWGAAWQYSRVYDFCTCPLFSAMWSSGGEIWDAKTGQIEGVLNTDANAAVMERYKSWLKYMPPGATNYGIAEEIDVFTQGKVATCLQWAAVGLAMINAENKDKVMVVPPPKFGKGAEAKRIYCMGGQPWVINAFNDDAKMRVAIDFMNWWYLPETAKEYAKRGGNPCDKATLSSSEFDDVNPWNRAYKFMLEPGRSRDFWHDPKYSEMLSLQQEGFTSFMTGQSKSARGVLDYIACGQQQILYDAGTAKKEPSGVCGNVSL
ncbi:ABC transporter substrate-binding protein [Lichenifustis flavocetrariae]|uniref:Substrate-binding domain-containing protein n=1 Tax=Lichenifustis flavocetrariae TaxID=2949735 RepID=A0AA42CM49_9HYPH|nr:substrate-binding domain-containing protein [Lichenifustis flavocetrariae]MCW6511161.1 substrate-binding domain-containing protein [Lichenifustis flavocetrariae]